VFRECVSPDYILVFVEISVKELAYLGAIDIIYVDQIDERVGFVEGHSRNLAVRRETTVPVKRNPHQVYPPIGINIEVGKDAAALEAQAKAAWPGRCRPNVFQNLHRHPPVQVGSANRTASSVRRNTD
jgi:hypothetical protein